MPESLSLVQTPIAVKTKMFTILTSNETVIIPKIIFFKPVILYLQYLDLQPSKVRHLSKKNFEKALWRAIKTALFRATTKTEVLSSFAVIVLSLFCWQKGCRAFHKFLGSFWLIFQATFFVSSNLSHSEQLLVFYQFWEIGVAFSF